ncbi:MAG: response regulator transcription factor [Myxococcales bacterium]|nr:response regulator transcription factor [Myxococcales bacterium]
MRVLVVDDEPIARRRLVRMLERVEGVEVAGEARDGVEGLARIAELAPDVVLLDIHMPRLDGLALARSSADLPPIIFTTAYAEHAVAAFEACAVDYLLKPVAQARLEQALAKVRLGSADPGTLRRLLERLGGDGPAAERIVARDGDALRVFDAREIARFHAADKYSLFHVAGREYLLEESLTTLAERLAPLDFVRVHRAELVSLTHVVALTSDAEGALVELRDGQKCRVSRRHVGELRRRLRLD